MSNIPSNTPPPSYNQTISSYPSNEAKEDELEFTHSKRQSINPFNTFDNNSINNIYDLFSENYHQETFELMGNKLTDTKFNIFLNFWLATVFIELLHDSIELNEEHIKMRFSIKFQEILNSLFNIFYEENVDEKIINNKKYLFDILNKNLLEKIHSKFHISFQNRNQLLQHTNHGPLVETNKDDIISKYILDNLYKCKLVKNFLPDDNSPLTLLLKIKGLDINYLKLFYKLDTLEDFENIQPKQTINIDESITNIYIETNDLYTKLNNIINIISSSDLPSPPTDNITNLNTRTTTKIRKSFSRRQKPSSEVIIKEPNTTSPLHAEESNTTEKVNDLSSLM